MRTVFGIHTVSAPGTAEPQRRVARFRVGLRSQILDALGEEAEPADADLVAVSTRLCAVREVNLPLTDVRKALQVAPYEVDGRVPFDLDAAVTTAEPLSSGRDGSRLLVASAPRTHLETVVAAETVEDHPQVILPEVYGLYAFARRLTRGGEAPVLFLDVRPGRTLLVALEGGAWLGTRTISTGWDSTAQARPDDATLTALRRAAQSLYLNRTVPEQVVVTGEGKGAAGEVSQAVAGELAKVLGMTVTPLDEFGTAFVTLAGSEGPGRVSVHAVAIGMALAAVDPKQRLNLRTGPFALSRGQEGVELRRAAGIGAGILLVLLMAWVDGFSRYLGAESGYEAAKAGLVEQYRQVFPDAVRVPHPVEQARQKLAELEERGLFSGSVTPMGVLSAVSQAIPKSLTIDVLEFSVDGKRMRMEAEAASFDAASQIESLLAAREEFAEVRVSDVKPSARGDKVKFRVSVTMTGGV